MFLFSLISTPPLRLTYDHVGWVPSFFARVKRPEREVDHLSLCIAKVKNKRIPTSTFSICIHGIVGFTLFTGHEGR
jgi:hypothetical protein